MLDCWMALNEQYTIELAEMVAPYRVYWMEECLPPHDFEGFGRLRAAIKSTRIVGGEHVYFRYGFRQLLEHNAAAIWQPDIHWCGGLTELRRIAALASAYDIPVIPHAGGVQDCVHFTMATTNAPWSEMFMPAPGWARRRSTGVSRKTTRLPAAPKVSTCALRSGPDSAGSWRWRGKAALHSDAVDGFGRRPGVTRAWTDQFAGRILLDRVPDPTYRSPQCEQNQRSVFGQPVRLCHRH